MSTSKSGETGGRYSDICGATAGDGDPCKLPAGWGTPGSQGGRCRYHGGCSTGPNDTTHLEDNDHAEDNPGGGAPEGNNNAEIHGGFSDWKKAYERFDEPTRAYADRMVADMRETAKEHAPEVDAERREQLIKEKATLMIMEPRTSYDVFATDAEDARGFMIETELEHNGATYTTRKVNPAFDAEIRMGSRQREIAKELRLWPGYQKTDSQGRG